MDTAVIGRGLDIAVHVCGLRIASEHVVVVSRARRDHRTQCQALNCREKQPFTYQPRCCRCIVTEMVLLHENAEYIRERLVECPGLAGVLQL